LAEQRGHQRASDPAAAAGQRGHQRASDPAAGAGQQAIGQAPGDLAILQSFVNTLDIEQGTDEFADAAALTLWFRRARLLADAVTATPADLADAIGLREALRGVLRSHVSHGTSVAQRRHPDRHDGRPQTDARLAPASQVAVSELRRISAGLPTRLDVGTDGQIRPAPGGSGVQAALARILLIAAESATLGIWTRLKVCSADDCQWAFYDRSPTRNGCWCSMQICGSRAKSRAYRQRGRAGSGSGARGEPARPGRDGAASST